MLSKRAWSLEAGLISRNDLLDRMQQENIPFNKEIYDIIVGMPEVHDDRNLKSVANDIDKIKSNTKLDDCLDLKRDILNRGIIIGLNKAIAICYKYIRESSDEKTRSTNTIDRFNDRYFFGFNPVPDSECRGDENELWTVEGALHSDVSGDSDTGSSED